MAQFIGRSVRLTLSDSTQVTGLVANVANGELQLRDVHFLNSGRAMQSANFDGSQISDLDILVPNQQSQQNQQHEKQKKQQNGKPKSAPAPPPAFVDPAIVTSSGSFTSSPAPAPAAEQSSGYESSSEESEVNEVPFIANEFKYLMNEKKGHASPAASGPGSVSGSGYSTPNGTIKPKKRKGKTTGRKESPSGWADQVVAGTKLQEFDFQANLDLFDKKTVFDEIRQYDTTLPGQRLVEHNKIGGQQKYGHREMVLGPAEGARATPSPTPAQSVNVHAVSSGPAAAAPGRVPTPSALSFKASKTHQQVPAATPLQIVELERASADQYGIAEQQLTENAGRAIAQTAVGGLGGASRFSLQNHNAKPLVVALVGNNTAGVRALAAARHLVNRRVLVVAVFSCSRNSLSPALSSQLKTFSAMKGVSIFKSGVDAVISTLSQYDSPPELVIDGLQGYQEDCVEDHDDASLIIGLVNWANRVRAGIISIDMPTGLDPSSGLPLPSMGVYIAAKWVLSGGLPLAGLLNSQTVPGSPVTKGEWTHLLMDVGFPSGAMKKKFSKTFFGADWLMELEV